MWPIPVSYTHLDVYKRQTCTFAKEENEDNVEWFLAAHPEFELVPLDLPLSLIHI